MASTRRKGNDGVIGKIAPELTNRVVAIQRRLSELSVPTGIKASNIAGQTQRTNTAPESTIKIPYVEKADTHFDYLLKEMQWLAADFIAERKRHQAARRKISAGVLSHSQLAEKRHQKEIEAAALKQRKLASKIARRVRHWWAGPDRILIYQQKMAIHQERCQAMNQQLVKLLQLTERYTKSLTAQNSDGTGTSQIERALASSSRRARIVQDYSHLKLRGGDESLYGADTTDDDSGSSYCPTDTASDDETTLNEAEMEERQLRGLEGPFVADPEELLLLRQEAALPVEEVIERWKDETCKSAESIIASSMGIQQQKRKHDTTQHSQEINVFNEEDGQKRKRLVRFAKLNKDSVGGHGDLNNSFEDESRGEGDNDDDDDDEFEPVGEMMDDETTMEAEEKLKQEMSYAEELAILEKENEMSVDELRKLYSLDSNVDMHDRFQDEGDTGSSEEARSNDGDEDDDSNAAADDEEEKEFEPCGDIVDDETTIEAEEKLQRNMSHAEELALLRKENEMSLEELRKLYAVDTSANVRNQSQDEGDSDDGFHDGSNIGESGSCNDDDDEDRNSDDAEFEPTEDTIDDERTMEAEEKMKREMTYAEELAILKKESEMSVDELKKLYALANCPEMEFRNSDKVESMNDSIEPKGNNDRDISMDKVVSLTMNNITGGKYTQCITEALTDTNNIKGDETVGRTVSAGEHKNVSDIGNSQLDDIKQANDSDINANDELERVKLRTSLTGNPEASKTCESKVQEGIHRSNNDQNDVYMDEVMANEIIEAGDVEKLIKSGEVDNQPVTRGLKRALISQGETAKRQRHGTDTLVADTGHDACNSLEGSAEVAKKTIASRPFMLSPLVKLREYQQIGLNWLVSLQTRRLNGILADEMGLGKTLQTIALFAYLASYKGIWGPHLVVVPTSVILNWETELKRFCPGLKILCYYGTAKRRKELRVGWTKSNWYHVVITSYQLAVQDSFAFKRKRWYYLVLDEAQNIKNFQSQRWQTLINFNTQRRLLLTGTPLQNSVMELWSLLHFLMPHIFSSRKEFAYWFADSMNGMIEGTRSQSDSVVNRLHGIIRPFVLRRLKKDVEKQMPGKFEHIIKCQLSRRQMFIYEEFMARSSTRQALKKGGNYMGMMNVLMQLRKVCNHPDLFEPRAVITPFMMETIEISLPSCLIEMNKGAYPSLPMAVSPSLRTPLWCGSQGQPSIMNALKHDTIESGLLKSLERSLVPVRRGNGTFHRDVPPLLRSLVESLRMQDDDEELLNKSFLNHLNSRRCKAEPFPYPDRLIDAVSVRENGHISFVECKHLTSPASLLALIRDTQARADEAEHLVKNFTFCVPKAGGFYPKLDCRRNRDIIICKNLSEMLLEPVEEYIRPFQKAHARLTSFFPDKRLVQFDSGKLQVLAELLRELKSGGHRALIFTQMSKMLDILEAFLNLNGHTYLRLDGSTGVDRRQRMMDRFNNDTKIFCFILSTRSGGMGVNLTGADSVIFYDTDWNPAMDAQAQDRAHRIGQTRDVHIYRLVTAHSIEENILMKAQQKKNLDVLIMDRGNFDASQLFSQGDSAIVDADMDNVKSVYTKTGLRSILGVEGDVDEASTDDNLDIDSEKKQASSDQMEKAMTLLEDSDDVVALHGAQKEAADELKEFDESIEYARESDGDDESEHHTGKLDGKQATEVANTGKDDKNETRSEETDADDDTTDWQKAAIDATAIEASLSPIERYGLRFRSDADPVISTQTTMEERQKVEDSGEMIDMQDINDIEKAKAEEERSAMAKGELLSTLPEPEDLNRQKTLYLREKSRLRATKKLRKLTGQDWEQRIDALSKHPFWYNIDTGEAVWEKPNVLLELEAYNSAYEKSWAAIPKTCMVHIMSYLSPFPDRMRCGMLCHNWYKASKDASFVRHVYPVEMGAYTRDEQKIDPNHYRTIHDALQFCLPGDTIELGDGHYWANEDICVDFPIRLIGDENNPSNVVIEMGGTLVWNARGGFCEGITFRRPKMASGSNPVGELLRLETGGQLNLVKCVFDNDGISNPVAVARNQDKKSNWKSVTLKGGTDGLSLENNAILCLNECSIRGNKHRSVSCKSGSNVELIRCHLKPSGGVVIELTGRSKALVRRCSLTLSQPVVIMKKEQGCSTTCNENLVTGSVGLVLPPGFKERSQSQKPL